MPLKVVETAIRNSRKFNHNNQVVNPKLRDSFKQDFTKGVLKKTDSNISTAKVNQRTVRKSKNFENELKNISLISFNPDGTEVELENKLNSLKVTHEDCKVLSTEEAQE